MKKTAIALTTLLVSGAYAQSSLTLSGAMDVGIEKSGSHEPFKLESGRSSNTYFRINGVEDLGGGLKAIFFIQTVVSADTGFSSSVGNDGSFVGLSGGFGSINLGKSLNPIFLQALTYSANGTKGVSGFSTLGDGAGDFVVPGDKGTLNNGGVTVNNQITYSTPNFSGFSATLGYAPSEVKGEKDHKAVALQYVNGALMVAVGHATRPRTLVSNNGSIPPSVPGASEVLDVAKGITNVADKYLTQVGLAYEFGVARATFLFQKDRNYKDSNSYSLGVTVPVSTGSMWASFDVRELANGENAKVLQLGYKHFLSKRTHLYANFGTRDKSWFTPTNTMTTDKRVTGYGFGVNHIF